MPARKQAAAPRGKSGLFAKVCQAIWGTAFVAPAAKCCGVTRKQVRRWLDDVAPVPPYAWEKLNSAAHDQVAYLNVLLGRLDNVLPAEKVVI